MLARIELEFKGPLYHKAESNTEKGKYTWPTGDVYKGDFVTRKMTGKGKYTWPTGNVHVGGWVDDKRSGKGKYKWLNGNVMEVRVDDTAVFGKGKLMTLDGSVVYFDALECQADKGRIEMRAKGRYQDGRVYDGDWVDGSRHGLGKLTWPHGRVHQI